MDFYYCLPFPYQTSCRRSKISTKDIRTFSKDFSLEKLAHFPFWGKRCINSVSSKLFHSKLHCSKMSPDCGPGELPKLYWSLGGYRELADLNICSWPVLLEEEKHTGSKKMRSDCFLSSSFGPLTSSEQMRAA